MPSYPRYSDGSHPRIAIFGAGFSGVCAAVQLKEQLGIADFVVFELLPDLGGTWLANSYPGAACDVPSHMYSYSFNLNPDWSEKYSSQREIFQYIKDTAAKFDVYKNIRFNTAVVKVEWSAKDGHWLVHTQRQQTPHHPTQPVELHTFDIVFSGIGALRVPAKPAIFDAFQGEKMHSAEWNHAVDLANKTVAVVGTGASAIQIIPSIQPRVRELITFQRTPTWIMPRNSNKYSGLIKMLFRFVPVVQWLYRCYLYLLSEFMLLAFFKNSLVSYIAPLLGKLHLRRQIGDKALRDKLLPRYPLGCKRVVVSDDYFPALAQSNVIVETDGIASVTADSIVTKDGTVYKPDVLVLATGFNVQDYLSSINMTNRHGVNVMDRLSLDTRSFYGICLEDVPNCFVLLGPNTGLGHLSIIFMIECQVNYAVGVVRQMMRDDICAVEIKPSAVDRFQQINEAGLQRMVWTGSCSSWYQHPKTGKINTLWHGFCANYWQDTRRPSLSDFNVLFK